VLLVERLRVAELIAALAERYDRHHALPLRVVATAAGDGARAFTAGGPSAP
jgi:hypothetical protein